MEKLICRLSYWLGIVCLVIAVIWKFVGFIHSRQMPTVSGAGPVGNVAFMHGSILFLVATIASAAYIWLNSQKP